MTTTAPPPGTDDADQARLDRALVARRVETDRLARSDRPTPDQYSESVLHATRTRMVERLHRDWTPFFGRLDTDDDAHPVAYVGPYAVHDPDDGSLLVQSWRAPTSAPFYEATAADPLGVRARHRYAIQDDRVTGRVTEHLARGEDAPDALRDAIVQQVLTTRTGSMQDIMTTITPAQHRVIRIDAPITVVQGGPGTGKTAVGLHRIAYLLFTRPEMAALVVGPSDRFIAYVDQVLPALGEDAVQHLTLRQLGRPPEGLVIARGAPRQLLGDMRTADLLTAAAWAHVTPPDAPAVVTVRGRRVTLTPDVVADAVTAARATGRRYEPARDRFRAALVDHVARALRRRAGVQPSSDVVAAIAGDRALGALVRATWPALTPAALLRRAFADGALLARHLDDDPGLVRAVRGTRAAPQPDTLLTALEELSAEVLGREPDGQRYDHVVVDEAQELTPVELRMVRRRLTASGHLTLLGDLSQQMGMAHRRGWEGLVDGTGLDTPTIRTLDTSYRVPADLLALAAPYAVDERLVPAGVRPASRPTRAVRGAVVADVAAEVADAHPDDTVGVLVPSGVDLALPARPRLSAVPLPDARGLEFGHVVLVEPAALLEEGGPGGLYIALTRAVKSLVIVHDRPLPPALADGLAALGRG